MKRKEMEQALKAKDRLLNKLLRCVSDAHAAAVCVERGYGEEHVVITTGRLATALHALREAGYREAAEQEA
jgi:hypothetical protein